MESKKQSKDPSVSDTQKLTNTPKQSMNTNIQGQETTEIVGLFGAEISPTLTSWWEDFRVNHLVSLESVEDLATLAGHSFLISQGWQETNNHGVYCWKTLKVYLVTKMELLSRKSLKFSPTLGIYCNGKFSIVSTTGSHRIGSECSLSAILEDNPDQKYFLSEKAKQYLVRRTADNKKMGRGFAARLIPDTEPSETQEKPT